jgi:glycosyltransferase involved in cell wall biosynthesis/O-antigen/teichoic acid export membrane protein
MAGGVIAAASRIPLTARWTVVDQGLSSASNLLFVVSVARGSNVAEFGAFSLAYIAYGLVLGAVRAIGGDVLLLRAEQQGLGIERDARRLLGVALTLGAVAGGVACAVAVLAGGALGGPLLAVGAVLPIVLAQDAMRYCLFARRAPTLAAVSDLTWLVVQLVVTVVLLLAIPHPGPAPIVFAWASGAAASLAVGLSRARLAPTFRGVAAWFSQDRARVGSFFGDFALLTGSTYAAIYLIPVIGKLEDVAAVRGAELFFAPLDTLFLGVRVVALPALARSAALGSADLWRQARLIAVLSAALTVAWAAAVLSLPSGVGRAVLGTTWEVVRPLILPIGLASVARYISLAPQAGLRAVGDVQRIVRVRVIVAVIVLVAVIVGTSMAGALGAAIGLATAQLTEAMLSWGGFLRNRRHRTAVSRPARVLRVIARMNIGGPAYHVSILSGRLDPERYVTLLAVGQVGPSEASFAQLAQKEGAHVAEVNGLGPELRPLRDLVALWNLIRLIRRFRPDLIHTHTAKAGVLGRLAALAAPLPRPVIVHTYHGHVLEGYFGPLTSQTYRIIERGLAHISDCLVGVSRATVEDLIRLKVAPRERFRTVPIGLDLDRFTTLEQAAGSDIRTRAQAGPDDVLLSFVGRLVPIKRVDVILRAVACARAAGAPIKLAVVGDGECRPQLEHLATELGLGDAATFLGYVLDVAPVLAATDIAVLSSDNEGTPVSLIEAGAAGLPAVTTDVGGVADVIGADGGILVPAGDADAFGRALNRLAASADLRCRMGERNRAHVLGNFSSGRLLHDIEALYVDLLGRRERRGPAARA